jgi:hypothetical protein
MTKSSKISKKKRGTTLKIRGGSSSNGESLNVESLNGANTPVTKEDFDKAKGKICELSFTPLLGTLLQAAITEKESDTGITKETIEKISTEIKAITYRERTLSQKIVMTSKGTSLNIERKKVEQYITKLTTLKSDISQIPNDITEVDEINRKAFFDPLKCNEIPTKITTSKRTACYNQNKRYLRLVNFIKDLKEECFPKIDNFLSKLEEDPTKDTIKDCKTFLEKYEPKIPQYKTELLEYSTKLVKYKDSYPT